VIPPSDLIPLQLTASRLRILYAFLKTHDPPEGHEEDIQKEYSEAIDLLQWGRERWAAVGRDERGPVFEKTFIRSVKRLKLLHMTKVCICSRQKTNRSARFT
jgi:hypothetical protein